MIIKAREIAEEDFGAVKVRELFNSEQVDSMSAALIKVSGVNRKIKNRKSDAFFYVLSGDGGFSIDRDTSQVVAGDLIFIPKNAVYTYTGNMTLLVFSSPRYELPEVEYLD